MQIAIKFVDTGIVANFHPAQHFLLFESNSGLIGDDFERIKLLIVRERLSFDGKMDKLIDCLVIDLSEVFADALIEI